VFRPPFFFPPPLLLLLLLFGLLGSGCWRLTSLWAHPRVELKNMWGRICAWERILFWCCRRPSWKFARINKYLRNFIFAAVAHGRRENSFMCFFEHLLLL
jgi:hypothetical protein